MGPFVRFAWIVLIGVVAAPQGLAEEAPVAGEKVRVLSWNISNDTFITRKNEFRAMLHWANPDIVLLDEVIPSANPEHLVNMLAGLRPGEESDWNINVGASGGRQRGIIASRDNIETPQEFASIVPYPNTDRRYILEAMSAPDRANPDWSMGGGIPVNGAVIASSGGRLLVVVTDLQCCGDGPESWQEYRRRVEAREIRKLIRQVLENNQVDGIVFAGDFNLVNSTFPLALLTGPYPLPHGGLIPAELYHTDGNSSWTWDGRGLPFPSNTLDYQLYGPGGLKVRSGLILDSEWVSPETREQLGLELDSTSRTGRHRPLVVEYEWQ